VLNHLVKQRGKRAYFVLKACGGFIPITSIIFYSSSSDEFYLRTRQIEFRSSTSI